MLEKADWQKTRLRTLLPPRPLRWLPTRLPEARAVRNSVPSMGPMLGKLERTRASGRS